MKFFMEVMLFNSYCAVVPYYMQQKYGFLVPYYNRLTLQSTS